MKQKQTQTLKHLIIPYMGPLLVLARLALRHRKMLIERMNTKRDATTTKVINMSCPLLDLYQGASSVGQISQI